MTKTTGQPPSDRYLDDSFDATARLDFDNAVILFGETIDARLQETKDAPGQSRRPKKFVPQVPKYTLGELLDIVDDDESDLLPGGFTKGAIKTDEDSPPLVLDMDWLDDDADDDD